MAYNLRPSSRDPSPQSQMRDQQYSVSPVSPNLSRRTSETRLGPTDAERPSSESRVKRAGGPESQVAEVNDPLVSVDGQNQTRSYKPVATDDQAHGNISGRRNYNATAPTIFADFAVVVLPLAVIVFIVLVWRLDGSQVGDDLSAWENAITVLATAFPILFASVIGRLMSEAARWKLEKGGTMGFLEQLMGSRTVGSTVITLFQLRTLNFVAIGLFLVWACSPLGAQAFLRMMDTSLVPDPSPVYIAYFDTQAPLADGVSSGQGSSVVDSLNRPKLASLATLYTILVGTPKANKIDAMDLWGNVRIPYLSADADGTWRSISNNPEEVEYSSLAGVPVHYAGTGNATFSLESSYIHLVCPNATKFPASDIAKGTANRTAKANVTTDYMTEEYPNGTWRGYDYQRGSGGYISTQWGIAIDRFVDLYWITHGKEGQGWDWMPAYADNGSLAMFSNETGITAGPTKFLLRMALAQPQITKKNRDNLEISCDITQKYVESRVSCSFLAGQRSCRVIEQRLSQKTHAPEQITQLSFPRSFDFFAGEMPVATGRDMTGFIDPTLYYLKDPTYENISSGTAVLMDELDTSKVGARFGQLLNTYLTLSQVSSTIANTSAEADAVFQPNITFLGESSTLLETYVISKLWISLCLLSAVVLLAGGILSVVFIHLTHGPEILGYVSTTIRNSKYIDLPSSTTWLDGSELTNELKKLRIRYGFIRDESRQPVMAVGHEEETARIKDVLARK
ncbi:hypothetical protein CGCS363_v011365 [Colletotrichum siamense]|uniref:uncharacterized protein n=1 Tax=Colletotrichum siamense TaxID=690259 RepID=UPI0018724D5D|nr:uncharacterized protein CGCS363_v011365 [Colletotrichum siamense]KAF5492137.1 hypothetical protein CGCS363_v011365 [Colletotrichum siamense]